MKVTKIEEINNHPKYNHVYNVTTEPNWLERLFGKKEKTITCRWDGEIYVFGSGNVYYDQNGEQVDRFTIGEAIDDYRRKW